MKYLFYNIKPVRTDMNSFTTLSLAYYIAQASTVISLGGRLQYLIANYESNAIFLDSIKFAIYGVTLTATYTFNI